MPNRYQIKQTVQFPEQTGVPKEQSSYALFDVIQEGVLDNTSYCQALIHKIFKLPYGQLPDFFSHHCKFIEDPIKWLNKLEKLIAENEDLFVTSTNRGRMMKCYTIIESKRREIKSILQIPICCRNIQLGTECRLFAVSGNPAPNRNLSVLLRGILFKVEQYLKC